MADDHERRVFGEVEAAAEAFEHLPYIVIVTEGPELRTIAFNGVARTITKDRLVHGEPILKNFPLEMGGQGWPEAYSIPTLTGESVTMNESRIQLQQPDGSVVEVFLDASFTPLPGPDGRPHGTVVLASDVTQRVLERRAAERELEMLRDRYSAARGSVRAMQRALLADSVPLQPAFDVAARYLLAGDEEVAGGDWFDAVAREDGSVVLVVGDVVGHGQAAAVAMGQLRSVLLAQLRAGSGVAEALTFLDGFAGTVPAARRATVCVVAVGETGNVEYCTAGHPPPLVLTAGAADTRYLPPTGAGPLTTGAEFRTAQAHLELGDAVVLYSDGILERPGVSTAAASLELRTTAGNAYRNTVMAAGAPSSAAERICTLTIELLTRASGRSDDITILAAQRRAVGPGLDVQLEVGTGAAQQARTALREWLHELDPDPADIEALLHATTELVANVVDHAHLATPASPFRMTARLEPGSRVRLDVADRGSWKLPLVTGQRGLGLGLVRRLVDELVIDRSPDGTTACIGHTVHRSADLVDRPVLQVEPAPEHFDAYAQDGPQPTVTISGPLDGANRAEAAALLNLALTEAAAVVTVDLTGVTLLASAGVDLLFRTIERARGLGLEIHLVAPNGSPAQHILSLVQLPYQQTPTPW